MVYLIFIDFYDFTCINICLYVFFKFYKRDFSTIYLCTINTLRPKDTQRHTCEYTNTCAHIHLHTHKHTHKHTHTHTHTHTYIHIHIYYLSHSPPFILSISQKLDIFTRSLEVNEYVHFCECRQSAFR